MLDEFRKNQEAADEAERRTAKLMAQLSKDLASTHTVPESVQKFLKNSGKDDI